MRLEAAQEAGQKEPGGRPGASRRHRRQAEASRGRQRQAEAGKGRHKLRGRKSSNLIEDLQGLRPKSASWPRVAIEIMLSLKTFDVN